MSKIDFDITIYADALSLLLSDKTDIRSEILSQLMQGDPVVESISNDLTDIADEKGLSEVKALEAFENESSDSLMDYISFNEANIEFDYGESQACNNLRTVAFNVPCEFDADKYLKKVFNN